MPQPVSKVCSNASIHAANAGERVISLRPELGVLVAEAIASWSNVEAFMLQLWVNLFGGDHTLAARVYLSLDGRGPKKAALKVAIEGIRDESIRKLIRAVIRLSESRQGQRDALAHGVWGHSPQLPDALLLLEQREAMNMAGPDRDNIMVYKARDFQEIVDANDRLCSYGRLLLFIVQGHVANQDGRLVQRLYNEPEIKEILDRPLKQT